MDNSGRNKGPANLPDTFPSSDLVARTELLFKLVHEIGDRYETFMEEMQIWTDESVRMASELMNKSSNKISFEKFQEKKISVLNLLTELSAKASEAAKIMQEDEASRPLKQ